MLYIIPTPIGNLKDITLRALEALQNCDGVICEDSRKTGILLNHYKIKKLFLILNDFNENKQFPIILNQLIAGQNLCLVSDAGTPLISDPGYKLVRECINSEIEVDSLPGASSILPALTLSGLHPDKFLFLGYLPEKQGKRLGLLKSLNTIYQILNTTFIAFVAPHKLARTLDDILEVYGDIEVFLAHELTKIHQSVKKQKVSKWNGQFKNQHPKGEYVLLFNLSKIPKPNEEIYGKGA